MVELAHANGINVVLATVMPVSDYNKDRTGKQVIRTVQRPPGTDQRAKCVDQKILRRAWPRLLGLFYADGRRQRLAKRRHCERRPSSECQGL